MERMVYYKIKSIYVFIAFLLNYWGQYRKEREVKFGYDGTSQHKVLPSTYFVAGFMRNWETKKPHKYCKEV